MGIRMSWVLIILSFTFITLSDARHGKKLPTAVVVGTVYCDTCFLEDFSKASHFISGASVAVECGDTSSSPSFRKEVKTNKHGEFKVHLPFSVSKHVKKINGCSVKLISSSEPYCAVASTATSSSLHLKDKKPGTHIFSAGFFTFKPLKQPDLCYQKPSTQNSKLLGSFPPPIQDPQMPILPPIDEDHYFLPLPELPKLPPLPQLPPLPPLPGVPYFPPVVKETTSSKDSSKTSQLSNNVQKVAHPEFFNQLPPFPLPPNPFMPPSTLPPNPFQPPSSSTLLPNPFQPPASVRPPVNLPGNTISTPPPSAIPFPLPPLPFQPSPGFFPGIPPAAVSASAEKKTNP